MREYIERENAYKLINEQKEKETGMYSKGRNTGLNIAKSIIHDKERCPTADVVEVVRCVECKYCEEWGRSIWCDKHTVFMSMKPTDFCSYGELKEREGK